MKTLFFTGYPGFLADNLLKLILLDEIEIEHIYLLVLPDQSIWQLKK